MYHANSQPLHNKIDRFMETFNKTISKFETKPQEILQDNIEFLENELSSKDEIIKTLMETQIAVLENLHLSKPPQQTENNTSFQKDVNQLNNNIIFKGQANQEYKNQSQNHAVNTKYQKSSKQQNRSHNQKSKQEKRLYIGNLDKDVQQQDLIKLFGFNVTTYLQENCHVDLPTGKNGKNNGFGFAILPKHVQKELLKLHEIEFHGNIIIIEKAASTRIKRPDEQKRGLSRNKLTESHTQGKTAEVGKC